ncbi:amp dependent CoA ligase [Mycena filopes]|nr:amp dependent CoA ligase [Mycena filopes]
MTTFSSSISPPNVPDDLTLEQFILRDTETDGRPVRPERAAWLTSDATGRGVHLKEIRERTLSLAKGLHSRFGILLIISSNHIDYPVVIWAIHRLCAIVSPCNPSSTVPELVHQLSQTRPTLIIAHSSVIDVALAGGQQVGIPPDRIVALADEGEPSRGRVTIRDLAAHTGGVNSLTLGRRLLPGENRTKMAFFCASSGTTGKPKVNSSLLHFHSHRCEFSHFAAIANVLQIAKHNKVTESCSPRYRPGDSCLAVLPFYHIYGLVVAIHFVLFSGMTVVVVPKFNFKQMLESIVRHKINQLMLVPPQVALLCKDPIVKDYDLSTVRAVLCAGAPLSAELNQQLIDLLPNAHIGQAYGQTESTGVASMWSIRTQHGFNGGELAPGVVARVVKPDGTLGSFNEPGELLLKTLATASGYFGDEKATRESFVDGWLHTGDQVMINPQNEVIYIDRIKVRGFQVAPAEIEGCMLGSELVADVCVVGIPDTYSGEVPLAFVVPTDIALPMIRNNPETVKASIMEYVATLKSHYKHVRRIEFRKILRRILRERAKGLTIVSSKL